MKEIGIFDLSNELVSQNTIVNSHIVAHNKMALKTAKSMLNPSILGSFMDLQTPKMFLLTYFIQKTFRNIKTNFCLKHCLYNHNFHEILAYCYYELQYVNLQYFEKLFG